MRYVWHSSLIFFLLIETEKKGKKVLRTAIENAVTRNENERKNTTRFGEGLKGHMEHTSKCNGSSKKNNRFYSSTLTELL